MSLDVASYHVGGTIFYNKELYQCQNACAEDPSCDYYEYQGRSRECRLLGGNSDSLNRFDRERSIIGVKSACSNVPCKDLVVVMVIVSIVVVVFVVIRRFCLCCCSNFCCCCEKS